MKLLGAALSRKWIFTTLLVLLGTAVCIRLGIWQLDRLEQRRAFNATYLQNTVLPPLVLQAAQEGLQDQEYRAVTLSGVYDFESQVALRNRYHEGEYGYHLITPLILADGSAVMVERGWIPAAGNETPSDWRKYDQPGIQTVSGILRLGQSKPDVGGVPDPELAQGQTHLDFWNILNLERLALQSPAPLLPVFVQPDPQPQPASPPYPSQPEIEITEGPHMGYAMQWFTFASILFFGYPFYLAKEQKTSGAI